ncbi:hypothetical protein CF327_g7656 [Tilletia walkeri]|nr:hypothetical protein CF327_g7656 [Tilletia walkeri]
MFSSFGGQDGRVDQGPEERSSKPQERQLPRRRPSVLAVLGTVSGRSSTSRDGAERLQHAAGGAVGHPSFEPSIGFERATGSSGVGFLVNNGLRNRPSTPSQATLISTGSSRSEAIDRSFSFLDERNTSACRRRTMVGSSEARARTIYQLARYIIAPAPAAARPRADAARSTSLTAPIKITAL